MCKAVHKNMIEMIRSNEIEFDFKVIYHKKWYSDTLGL